MTDDVERAQAAEQVFRDDALARQARRFARRPAATPVCRGCCELIDPRRLLAVPDADRCAECQDRWERYGS
jgi:DnaK suppressor protein